MKPIVLGIFLLRVCINVILKIIRTNKLSSNERRIYMILKSEAELKRHFLKKHNLKHSVQLG